MNIWAWVERLEEELREAGRGRLADLMELVPEYMSDNKHEQLDAIMPEALALAREAKLPWVEVFLRHWQLQSCILQRYLVREYLPEAVSLIELANREDTRDCPQSVCTTQDLANCYAHADGPGYVKERLAVASETLARITPDWPCFTCISGEYATALIDSEDPGGALEFVRAQKDVLVRAGRADRRDDMCGTEIDSLILLGRFEEALELNERSQHKLRGESFLEFRRLDRARILARMGRLEDAKRALPPFEKIERTPSQYEPWVDAVECLAAAGTIDNDAALYAQLERLHRTLRKNGVIRRAIRIAHAQARLSLAAGRPYLAKRSAAALAAMIPELRAALNAPAELAQLYTKIAELHASGPELTLPEAPGGLPGVMSGELDRDLQLLERALVAWPDDEPTAVLAARAWFGIGDAEAAKQLLYALLERNPEAADAMMVLLHMLRERGERGELERYVERVLAASPGAEVAARCEWALALREYDRGDFAQAKVRLQHILSLKPEAINAALLLAELHRRQGAYAEALALLDGLVARTEPGAWDWERILVGTLLERWDVVRASMKRVGFTGEGEGPVETEGELCRVAIAGEGDDDDSFYAIRTGPATARIVEVAPPQMPQHYGDRVVIEPRPKNDPPAAGEERHHTFIYPCVSIAAPGGYRSFAIDGFHPGVEGLARMRAQLSELRLRLEVRSDESYRVEIEGGAEVPGLYAFLAVPGDVELEEVREVLRAATAGFERPLIWPGLAEAIGDLEEVERHQLLGGRYGF